MKTGNSSSAVSPAPLPSVAEREAAFGVGLAETRADLSGLVRRVQASKKGIVSIQVHGRTKAFLVSPARLEALLAAGRPREARVPLRGSVELTGSPEDIEQALKRARAAAAKAAIAELARP